MAAGMILALCLSACAAQNERLVAAFWNVENLYDAHDDNDCNDDEFTPGAPLHWTEPVYHRKLAQIAAGINLLGGRPDPDGARFPDLLGLAEIERRRVLSDLLAREFAESPVAIVHEESPDERGIDVALLFRTDRFREVRHEALHVRTRRKGDTTRDVLFVELASTRDDRARLFVLVNHWPSRMDEASARTAAARVCRAKVDDVLAHDPDADLLVMGDLNDEPDDRSVARTLGAGARDDATARLVDLAGDAKRAGLGTIRHERRWELFDQMIVSRGLLGPPGYAVEGGGFRIVDDPLLRVGSTAEAPPRRFVFRGAIDPNGFSDHLPVVVRLERWPADPPDRAAGAPRGGR